MRFTTRNNTTRSDLRTFGLLMAIGVAMMASVVAGQSPQEPSVLSRSARLNKVSETARKSESRLIRSVVDPELVFRVAPNRSRLLRTTLPIARIAITDATFVEVNEFSPNEVEVIGQQAGETTMTLWFKNDGDPRFTSMGESEFVLRYLVKVEQAEAEQQRSESKYALLEARINEMFPNSRVQLFPISDKLILRGQAADAKEAAQILAIASNQTNRRRDFDDRPKGGESGLNGDAINDDRATVVNLMHVPGEHQVMLKVRVAELSRSATRELGVDIGRLEDAANAALDAVSISGVIGATGNMTAILNHGDLSLFIRAFSANGQAKIPGRADFGHA